MKPIIRIDPRNSESRYISYVVGFVLSILTTLAAYLIVVKHLWPMQTLVYIVLGVAVVQLVVQLVFFLHIGRGSKWKFITFLFAILVVLIIVVGSIWIMNNLNYNMIHMSPDQMQLYMHQNEGI
ncbi:MAG: cyoD [Candidatus Saccharibacteria bacterium]|nr:cyoD [Candidatus Saccharibacteria bacterium]